MHAKRDFADKIKVKDRGGEIILDDLGRTNQYKHEANYEREAAESAAESVGIGDMTVEASVWSDAEKGHEQEDAGGL